MPAIVHESESSVQTACPLDCPDGCSLSVTVRDGRITAIDGGDMNPVTQGYICAKVRHFHERMYGDSRLRYPLLRGGSRAHPTFTRLDWDEALDIITDKFRAVTDAYGAESILPFCYGGSNGFMTQDSLDAVLFRRLGTSRLARTVCAAPTGAANLALYGKMPSVVYQDYPEAQLVVVWGMNPATSGIHAMPYLKEVQKRGGKIVVVDPRTTTLARSADLHLAVRPGSDVAVALAVHRVLFEEGHADHAFLETHTSGAPELRARAAEWTIERAADVAGIPPEDLRAFADLYTTSSPALVRCGWGLERNRNGGNAAAAVLALPAVGGKFGVRGGGFAMSNSASWDITRPWLRAQEPQTRLINMNRLGRVLTEPLDPPVKLLFVYNCNPVVTMPDQQRVMQGLAREDLFTVVFDQVFTDTAYFADVVLPATTFLENYDFSRSYGPLSILLGRPVVDPIGEARSNADVFGALAERLGVLEAGEPSSELDLLLDVMRGLPPNVSGPLEEGRGGDPPWDGRPVQFVDVFPRTPDRKAHLFPAELEREAPLGLYRYQPDPATGEYPLALISPASDRTVSSTLGELSRPEVKLLMHPHDAAARNLADDDSVRIWNTLGEVRCHVQIGAWIRPGTVMLPKGLWRKSTSNGFTANALAPDTLTDLGGGACFNDARVQVSKV